MKPITIEEYREYGPEFFKKFNYVRNELGLNSKAEDIIKVMESLASLVMAGRKEKNSGPMGFNKEETKTETDKEKDDQANYDTGGK